jgi:hypothetical protein
LNFNKNEHFSKVSLIDHGNDTIFYDVIGIKTKGQGQCSFWMPWQGAKEMALQNIVMGNTYQTIGVS